MNADDPIANVLRTTRIIVLALAFGLAIFIVIVVVRLSGAAASDTGDLVGYMAAALLAGSIATRFFMPPMVAATMRRRILAEESSIPDGERAAFQSQRLLEGFTTQLIACAAFTEGPGFLGAVGYMLGGNAVGIAVALGAALLLLTLFPTRERIEEWLRREQQALQLDRSLPR